MGRKTFKDRAIDDALRVTEKALTETFENGVREGIFINDYQARMHYIEYLPGYDKSGKTVCGLKHVRKTRSLKEVTCQRCLINIQARLGVPQV